MHNHYYHIQPTTDDTAITNSIATTTNVTSITTTISGPKSIILKITFILDNERIRDPFYVHCATN